jgi:hypothetical protein
MSNDWSSLIDELRDAPISGIGSHPRVAELKELEGERAAAFVRAHRDHLDRHGPLATTLGAAIDIAAFAVSDAVLERAGLGGETLLAHPRWPSSRSWDRTMLALASTGGLSADQIVKALASPGFAAGAAMLLPFGTEDWALALRDRVARWPEGPKSTWSALVELSHGDLPLRPSAAEDALPAALSEKALRPCFPDIVQALRLLDAPTDGAVVDPSAPSGLGTSASKNAQLLHALVLAIVAMRPEGTEALLRHVREVASKRIPGLGTYLPKLAARAALGLDAPE